VQLHNFNSGVSSEINTSSIVELGASTVVGSLLFFILWFTADFTVLIGFNSSLASTRVLVTYIDTSEIYSLEKRFKKVIFFIFPENLG